MEYLLTSTNLKVLESFALVKTLYAFDYDGTLAPISSDPDKAFMIQEVTDFLKKLNSIASVAIITGRSTEEVKKFLDFEPEFIIGNHGIEGSHSEEELLTMEGLVVIWKKMLGQLPADVRLEVKKYSLSLHFQNDISALMPLIEQLPEATLVGGKSILNILPKIGMNKGQALNQVMRNKNFHFGFFIGDDVTDENVFAYKSSRLFTVKVGRDPDTMAKYYINTQTEILDVLKALVNFQRIKL